MYAPSPRTSGGYPLPGVGQRVLGGGDPSLSPAAWLVPGVLPTSAVLALRQYSLSCPGSPIPVAPSPAGLRARAGHAMGQVSRGSLFPTTEPSEVAGPQVVWSAGSPGMALGLGAPSRAIPGPGVGVNPGGGGAVGSLFRPCPCQCHSRLLSLPCPLLCPRPYHLARQFPKARMSLTCLLCRGIRFRGRSTRGRCLAGNRLVTQWEAGSIESESRSYGCGRTDPWSRGFGCVREW